MCVNVCDLLGIHFVTVTGKIRFQVIQLNGLSRTATLGTEERDLCKEV